MKYHEHKYHSNSEEQLRQVAHALYLAKVHGTSQYHILDQAQEDAERSHHLLLAQIEWGLQKQEFELYFQPKVNMLSGAVIGAEALIRWQHPEKGLIGPGEFIPVTENHPIAMHIDQWVMQEAIHHLSLWQERFPHLELSINISAMSIQNPEFSRQLRALLKKHQEVSAQCLQIEMLENSAMQDMCVAIATLKACRELGVSIAIDDFGTGYSSLSYLRRMPIDWLKLDKSFVANMEKDAGDTAIIRGIIGMGESFGISIIAEGVETLEQGAQLIRMGCLHGQGYAISRPLTAQAFEQWLQNWQQPPLWRDALAEKT
ncbi:MAG: EAL domain-containing protein [Gammaproteobacteria bacterium]